MAVKILGMAEFTTAQTGPERNLFATVVAVSKALPLGRPLTAGERLAVAVIAAGPSHVMHLSSQIETRSETATAFKLFRERLSRSRVKQSRGPWIYAAAIAQAASGEAGFHVHALMWDYLHAPVAGGHARDVGFGWPQIEQLPSRRNDLFGYCSVVTYVFSQHEAVFGSETHTRHAPLPKGARAILTPQAHTLGAHCPKLLRALKRARDQSVPDECLLREVPSFKDQV